MDTLTPLILLKLSPGTERDRLYRYPYTGPYEGEPDLYEILHRKEAIGIWGPDRLSLYCVCPACGSFKAELIRNEYAICYDCLLTFERYERYIDLTIDEEMEYVE